MKTLREWITIQLCKGTKHSNDTDESQKHNAEGGR